MAQYNRRLTKQPQGAVGIDWSNPITRDMFWCGTPTTKNLQTVNSPTIVPSPTGLGWKGNNSDSYHYEHLPVFELQGNTRGICIAALVLGAPPNGDCRSFAFGSSTNTNPILAIGNGLTQTDKVRLFLRDDNNNVAEIVASNATAFENQKPHFVLINASSSGVTVWIDGNLDIFTGLTVGKLTLDRVAINALLRNTAATPAGTTVTFAAAWNRSLVASEIQSISDNPWQLFANQQNVFFGPVTPAPVTSIVNRKPSSGAISRSNLTINRDDPITDGLLVAMDADSNFDYANNQVLVPRDNYSITTKVSTKYGRAVNTNNIGDQGGFNTGNWSYIQSNYKTGVTMVYVGGINHTGGNLRVATFTPAAFSGISVSLQSGSNTGSAVFSYSGSFGDGNTTVTGLTQDKTDCSVFAVATSSFQPVKLYLNGENIANGPTAGGVTNRGISGGAFGGGRYIRSVNSRLILGWNRQLTDEEIKRVSQDPWCMFKKQNRFVPSISSATLIPSIFALVPSNITGSSLKPRYQLTF